MPDKGHVLAFDFGERRIGVAVGSCSVGIAHPLCTIDSRTNTIRFARIAQLITQWQAMSLVVGLPTHRDGSSHTLTHLAQRFAQRLKGRFHLAVHLVDERYTSLQAASLLHESGINTRQQKPIIDQVAAQLILQSWFDAP